MAKQDGRLEQKIEAMIDSARQIRRANTFNPGCPAEQEGYYTTKNTAFLLEGYASPTYRKVRSNQRDEIIGKVLEKLDNPDPVSEGHIWEEAYAAPLLEEIKDRNANPKADVIVTGIQVPEWYDGDFVDPVKYAQELAELSNAHPVFVSTGIRNQRVYDILTGTKVNLVTRPEKLNGFIKKLIIQVFPKDRRTPERRHAELMEELLGSWQARHIFYSVGAILDPKIITALRLLYGKK
ncbi:hypothetical protein KY358_02345 [Candidatus Woesearchaeota archaeon]|nr:hypothetical protein [Candidatus Woesearchaeota archaeon]